jgi:long-chain acyl-CoA synthetase
MTGRPDEWIAAHARHWPDKPALIMAESGQMLSYAQLDQQSTLLGQALRTWQLQRGDHIAIMLRSRPELFAACWAAQRSGLYFTVVNGHLQADEAAYIVDDCGARVLFTDVDHADVATALVARTHSVEHRVIVAGELPDHESFDGVLDIGASGSAFEDCEGSAMLYSSGTTGQPKGVKRTLGDGAPGSGFGIRGLMKKFLNFSSDAVYLSPAPPYHAAPLNFSMGTHRLGGSVVAMERFDPERLLAFIEQYRVTHTQLVPTMFVRLLALPEKVRCRYRLDSLRMVVHSAAPCPVDVKRRMIEWLGPIVFEFYGGTERNGATFVTPQEWLSHPGTVGKPMMGELHILDDDGHERPAGEIGTVYFANGQKFAYHNDPQKTRSTASSQGWTTIGDIGYVDGDGYLFLTDRKAYVIIRGGVNVYPLEIENVLNTHPAVAESAVFGIPHRDLGQEVRAVVQLRPGVEGTRELERALVGYCREQLARYKCPKSVDFVDKLERTETGKLVKKGLVEQYAARVTAAQ